MASILVTGGAGFIGANFVYQWLREETSNVVVLDRLTYAGNLDSLEPLTQNEETARRFVFVQGDIADPECVADILRKYDIEKVVHFAAESHVDRSIDGPAVFVQTNVLGTFVHTSRLQYIEFFNKFYVDGGRPFKPALPAETYTFLPEPTGVEQNEHA